MRQISGFLVFGRIYDCFISSTTTITNNLIVISFERFWGQL